MGQVVKETRPVPDLKTPTPNRIALIAAALAALGLAACDSETPKTIQLTTAGLTPVSSRDYGPPPPPPQPSYQPVIDRDATRVPGYDGTLASMVESAIKAEPELNNIGIEVSAVDGTIYLRGHARTRDSRRLATQVASAVDGVKRVQNELYVTAGS
jgi:hypothetical protein